MRMLKKTVQSNIVFRIKRNIQNQQCQSWPNKFPMSVMSSQIQLKQGLAAPIISWIQAMISSGLVVIRTQSVAACKISTKHVEQSGK